MKPILFIDFDGTLCHDRLWRSLDEATNKRIQEFLFGKDKELVVGWMRREYTSEDINKIVSKKLDIPYDRLWDVFVLDCKDMEVSRATLSLINNLRTRYYTVLMTDNMDCFMRFTVPALGLDRYFDQIHDSYTRKCLKNEAGGKSFVDVTNGLKSSIAGSILIDNSNDTCRLFEKLGGKALLVDGERTLDHWLEKVNSSL